jgi:hypothetical protein
VTAETPPRADELEISIFGPGRGECVLVHLGDNEWCIVDSCIARGSPEPVAVEYLRRFENDALKRVKLVVATHWHDDHIGGLASILDVAPQATFCCSMALRSDEFVKLVAVAPEAIQGHSGVEEFASVLKQLEAKGQIAPIFAVENRKLLSLSATGRSFPISLVTLSPSDPTIKLALKEIGSWLPKEGEPQRRIVASRNHASVVLWIEVPGIRALLGADLEHTGHAGEGWMAVLASHQDPTPARIFKVPHHGSISSDFQEVWQKMLTENPVAVVTPFAGGRVRLPKETDLERLCARTTSLYCTTPGSGKPPARDPAVERNMKLLLTERSVIEGRPGHVRIRWSPANPLAAPQIELFNGAYHRPPN